ncbi:hypothetical protein GLOIN_2v1785348 [Rhizophagus irregularis DAOM 181602=DAOM 197198]|nr:hypothetical protein GLOIN_2v1785348 [Rhizophagus irregularis DAOM 181602=DAOM 197198]
MITRGCGFDSSSITIGDGWRSGISKATALPLPSVLEGAWIEAPEGTEEVRVGAGAEGEVISTFIASSVTIRERLLGASAVVVGDKGQSPERVEVIGRGGGGISGLITEGAGGEDMVEAQ